MCFFLCLHSSAFNYIREKMKQPNRSHCEKKSIKTIDLCKNTKVYPTKQSLCINWCVFVFFLFLYVFIFFIKTQYTRCFTFTHISLYIIMSILLCCRSMFTLFTERFFLSQQYEVQNYENKTKQKLPIYMPLFL